jgi:hypothetical protein
MFTPAIGQVLHVSPLNRRLHSTFSFIALAAGLTLKAS